MARESVYLLPSLRAFTTGDLAAHHDLLRHNFHSTLFYAVIPLPLKVLSPFPASFARHPLVYGRSMG
jgi:hypothetical protein